MSERFAWQKAPAQAAAGSAVAHPVLRGLLVVLPFLVLASYGLFDPHLLGYHHSRQSHDALMARTFATTTATLFRPAIEQGRARGIRGCGTSRARTRARARALARARRLVLTAAAPDEPDGEDQQKAHAAILG